MHSSSKRGGFTLIELMVVVAIIAILMAIIIPGLLRARIAANQVSAVGTIKTLSASQQQFKNAAVVDADGDGSGEYGYFIELAGVSEFRTQGCGLSADPISPSFITSILGESVLNSPAFLANKSGYVFRMFLPEDQGSPGPGVAESVPLVCNPIYADQQEQRWVVYAWPSSLSVSGNNAYFGDQRGEIFSSENVSGPRYSGTDIQVVDGNSALEVGSVNLDGSPPPPPATAIDGQLWVPQQ